MRVTIFLPLSSWNRYLPDSEITDHKSPRYPKPARVPFEPLRFLIIQSRLTPPRPHRFEFYVSLTLEKAVWEAVPRSAHSCANVIDKKIRGDVRRSMVNNRL